MERCVLTIYAPPALEETLVDWLLENTAGGFSTTEAYGHGEGQTGMTLLEQVTGRQRRVQFTVQTDTATANRLLAQIKQQFGGVGLYYLLVPVLDAGRV